MVEEGVVERGVKEGEKGVLNIVIGKEGGNE